MLTQIKDLCALITLALWRKTFGKDLKLLDELQGVDDEPNPQEEQGETTHNGSNLIIKNLHHKE